MARARLIAAEILDERVEYSLRDLCDACGVSAEHVIDMVAEGVVDPHGRGPQEWRFTGIGLVRVRTALRLQRDLRVNLAGAALALELIEELETLRRHVRAGR